MSPEEFDEMSKIVGSEFDSMVSSVAGVFPPWEDLRQAVTASDLESAVRSPEKGLFLSLFLSPPPSLPPSFPPLSLISLCLS